MPVIVMPVSHSEHVEAAIVCLNDVDLLDLLHKVKLVARFSEAYGAAAVEWTDEQWPKVLWASYVYCHDEEMTVALENKEYYLIDGQIPKYDPASPDLFVALAVTPTGLWWKSYCFGAEITTVFLATAALEEMLADYRKEN